MPSRNTIHAPGGTSQRNVPSSLKRLLKFKTCRAFTASLALSGSVAAGHR